MVPSPRVLMQRRMAEYRAAADRGDLNAMMALVAANTDGVHAPVDMAAGEAWLSKAEARALTLRDGVVLGSLGHSYLNPGDGGLPIYAGKRDRAVRILTAATQGDFGTGRTLAMNGSPGAVTSSRKFYGSGLPG